MLSTRESIGDEGVAVSDTQITSGEEQPLGGSGARPGAGARPKREYRHDRYGLVCALILVTILSTAVLGDGPLGLLLSLALMIVTLTATLRTSNAPNRTLLISAGISTFALIAIGIAVLTQNLEPAKLAYSFLMILLVAVTPVVIARHLARHTVVTRSTVTGAAAIYLLIGLLFAVFYSLMGTIMSHMIGGGGNGIFFTASRPIVPSDFAYYSFTTLTTVGYGDLTASIPFGRMVSITEALIGQLYLVTVVSLLVANVGRGRRLNPGGPILLLPEEEVET